MIKLATVFVLENGDNHALRRLPYRYSRVAQNVVSSESRQGPAMFQTAAQIAAQVAVTAALTTTIRWA